MSMNPENLRVKIVGTEPFISVKDLRDELRAERLEASRFGRIVKKWSRQYWRGVANESGSLAYECGQILATWSGLVSTLDDLEAGIVA
jgi:hypothetical protein